jgi:PPOX class probable F420-dependent enzyme
MATNMTASPGSRPSSGTPRPIDAADAADVPSWTSTVVTGTTLVTAAFSLVGGVWALLWPVSFADAVDFPDHVHFLHDIGAFQIGIGAGLLLALIWEDSLTAALAGFLVANTVHTVNHAVDLDLGGQAWTVWALALLSVLVAVALAARWDQRGRVVGRVPSDPGRPPAPSLAPFVRQKTVALTTYRRDGTPVSAPVSLVVEGERAYVRSPEKGWKVRRIARDPRVVVAPSTGRGRVTGPGVEGRARRLEGVEARHAARLLARKHPLLHGIVVPLAHRLGRRRTGRTVHLEVVPSGAEPDRPSV